MDTIHYKVDGTKVEHRDFHNAYGAMQQRSSFRGLLKRDDFTRRPFVLTRSFFLGSQKFGTYWTGDNRSIYSEVAGSMRMIMSLGLSGHPFGGADVPGFYGVPSQELWVMFYQMGAYYPFFRAHTHLENPDREPWLQTQRVQTSIRATLNRRYDMIHYLYTTFFQTSKTAEPIMRPMWQDFPQDTETYGMTTQFMWGNAFLVAPKITAPTDVLVQMKMQSVDYYLPEGELWYNYDTKLVDDNMGKWTNILLHDQEQAVFVKGGNIIPVLLHENCESLLSCIENPIRVEVYVDRDGNANGYMYLDDGETLSYETDSNASALINFNWNNNSLYVNNKSDNNYQFPLTQRITQVAIYGIEVAPVLVTGAYLEIPFVYDPITKCVMTSGFAFDLNENLTVNLVWN